MKKLWIIFMMVVCLSGCNYESLVNEATRIAGEEAAYVSSNDVVFVYLKYDGSDDLDIKYELYGDLIEEFSTRVEERIAALEVIETALHVRQVEIESN